MRTDGINRIPMDGYPFGIRDNRVKWPTLRGAFLSDATVPRLEKLAVSTGNSIIFLDGTYKTNLNFTKNKDEMVERAVFFEWLVQSRQLPERPKKGLGGIFLLCWVGNFHNGSIFHCAWQHPQWRLWAAREGVTDQWFDERAMKVYRLVARTMYSDIDNMDSEVEEFITQPKS